MTSLSEIVHFLMRMMSDDKTKLAFAKDPQGTLAGHGLHGVSGQDVRDAHLMMCDDGSVHPKAGHSGGGGHHDDPVRAVQHITNNYEVTEVDASHHTSIGEINVLNIDDRDTTVIDSFNSDDDTNVVAVQDNDTINETTNTDVDVTNVEDSFNEAPPDAAPDAAPEPVEDPAAEPEPEPAFEEAPVAEVDDGADLAAPDPVDDPADDVHEAHDGAFDPAVAG